MMDEFTREYMAQPPAEGLVYRAALREFLAFEVQTEAFDREVCTGGIHPDMGAIPIDVRERSIITQNYKQERALLNRRLIALGCDGAMVQQVRRNHVFNFGHEAQRAALVRLTEMVEAP